MIVARPADGLGLVLNATVASLWHDLERCHTMPEIERSFDERYSLITGESRRLALEETLGMLVAEGLVEYTAP